MGRVRQGRGRDKGLLLGSSCGHWAFDSARISKLPECIPEVCTQVGSPEWLCIGSHPSLVEGRPHHVDPSPPLGCRGPARMLQDTCASLRSDAGVQGEPECPP